MNIVERLSALRAEMAKRNLDAYIVPTDDFHGSEYVGDYFKARAFLSGFTGSAGVLVVMKDRAALWTDGRYFIQAAAQLEGSTIELMKMGEPNVPEIPDFLKNEIPENGRIGYDARVITAGTAKLYKSATDSKNITYYGDEDLAGIVWADRPMMSKEKVWELTVDITGVSRADKIADVRKEMKEKGKDVLVLAALDEVAWLLNLRGNDVACTPVFEGTRVFLVEIQALTVPAKANISRIYSEKIES